MIAIGNGEACPFCTKNQLNAQQSDDKVEYKDIFISTPDNDFLQHLMERHRGISLKQIFGKENIRL